MSLGIAGMRERAELLNGRLDIKSKKGRGTVVIAYLPRPSEEGKI
jgi:signal transduction histidine kinase